MPALPQLVRARRGGIVTTGAFRRGQKPPNWNKRYPVEILYRDEIDALLAAFPRHIATGERDHALTAVLWRCGLRIGEALALLPKDFDRASTSIAILRGKGHKRRVVGIDAEAIEALEAWLVVRAQLGIGPRSPIFCQVQRPATGQPWAYTGARETLNFRARRAGIVKRVHPHGLRHTNAFELAMEGVPIPVIRDHLGHQELTTTARYIDHLAPRRAIRHIAARSWDRNAVDELDGGPGVLHALDRVAPGRSYPPQLLEAIAAALDAAA